MILTPVIFANWVPSVSVWGSTTGVITGLDIIVSASFWGVGRGRDLTLRCPGCDRSTVSSA